MKAGIWMALVATRLALAAMSSEGRTGAGQLRSNSWWEDVCSTRGASAETGLSYAANGRAARDMHTVPAGLDDVRPALASDSTAAAICAGIRSRVQYVPDEGREDQWKDPARTLAAGRGDCEDFALCVQQRCTEAGIAAQLYRIYPKEGGMGHVIVVGVSQGQTWMSSNGSYADVRSFEHAIRETARNMGWDPDRVDIIEGAPAAGGRDQPAAERSTAR